MMMARHPGTTQEYSKALGPTKILGYSLSLADRLFDRYSQHRLEKTQQL